MPFLNSSRALGVAVFVLLPMASLAADIVVSDAYARVSRPNAPTGAAFMTLSNNGSEDDRLLSAQSEVASRVELHTHEDQGDGIMKMIELEEGIALSAGASHHLKRGGDHIMFMGLVEPLVQGGEVTVTLTFERAGEVMITVPVDNDRKPRHGGDEGHTH